MFQLFINQDDRKIRVISGLTITTLILFAGLIVYSIIRPQTESIAAANLKMTLEKAAKLIETDIAHAISNTRSISTQIALVQHLRKTNQESNNDGIRETEKFVQEISAHFSSVEISGAAGESMASLGEITHDPDFAIELNPGSDIRTTLFWKNQFIIRNTTLLPDAQQNHPGRITTEATIPELTEIFKETISTWKTASFMLCTPTSDNNLETNCLFSSVDGNRFERIQQTNNKPLPIHFALAGQHGIQFKNDTVTAYAPLVYGIGIALKIDKKEFRSYLTDHTKTIVFYLSLLVLIGMTIAYWLTIPLIQKTIKSRNTSIEAQEKLVQAKNDAEKISAELTAYLNAIGKLALISISDSTGKIIQVNEKFCEVSGYFEEELIGQDHRILNSGKHPRPFFADMWNTIAKGKIWHQEICNRNKFGELYWVDSTIVPLMNSNGMVERYLSVRVDITAHKQKDLYLNERLKESDCLNAVRRFLEQHQNIETTCQNILASIIQAFQFPGVAVAMIKLGNKQVSSANYRKNLPASITAMIVANGETSGQLTVAYPENLPFALPYEQNLIDSIAHDIGRWYERNEAEKRIIEMATHDALTGLPNRHLLQDRIKQALAHEMRRQKQMAILFIDLDHFKTINDSLGHEVGDLLLKVVAERLQACVRKEDTVARQGGDEFIVVLNFIAESLDAAKVAQKILETLRHPIYIHKNELHISGSIGISVFPDDGTNADTLLKNGDAAMYYAKENGRNNYQFFTSELNKSAYERHALSLDLRYALERNELILYYQPVMDMPGHQLYSVEALIRWQHPEHKLVAPDKFINLAEETGLIIPIGEWVLKTVCDQIKTWEMQGLNVPRVAINLSARQFRDKELTGNISRILSEKGVEAKHIALEITESMLISNIEQVVETLNCLNAMGIHISIDDFGTGYSSLSYLKRFPIHTLKIDRTFVRDIVTDRNDHTIVATIIAMAHSLEIDVIAEGIETEEQLNLLIAQKCNHFQGYFFSKPVPATEIAYTLQRPSLPISKIQAVSSMK